ncbi:exosome complex component RRP46 isoform X1 [Schistocerca nitens]|uniref:exosome complex component RRP46 isoform X1 n=1 Tax=Schistocerca nitens TaxID=7011 RepID=UPI00211871A2|nr:exosome complex component RRP46 isoform X1 [Schistocerca nitens]
MPVETIDIADSPSSITDPVVTEEQIHLRPIHFELNVVSRSDGSAILTQGNTAVMAGVFGPAEVKLSKILIDRANVEAIYRPKTGLPTVADRTREALIKNTCEAAIISSQYPRTNISVIVQEMQDSGGFLACSINASCLALMNSGIAMRFLVAAVNCMIDKRDEIILDPSDLQSKDSKASLTFVFESQKKSVVASHTEGHFSQLQFQECLLRCRHASDVLFKLYREIVKKYTSMIC